MTERLLSTAEAAELLDVPASVIGVWKNRGRVAPAQLLPGRGRGGLVPFYRAEDLSPLAAAYHARRRHDTPS